MSWFEVHVFGCNTSGEGIILRLPDSRYAVVDCCFHGDLENPSANPMVKFLQDRGARKLAFVGLTHPHEDHYFGLSQFIMEFDVEQYFCSSAMTPHRLVEILEAEQIYAYENKDTKRQKKLRALRAIADEWKRKKKRAPTRLQQKQPLYPFHHVKNPSLSIEAISPSNDDIQKYEDTISRCLRSTPGKIDHNIISVGLLIKAKKFRVVLGSDMVCESWKTAMNFYGDQLRCTVLKASHHGSSNGYCDGLLELMKLPRITATRYSSSRLPEEKVLSYFMEVSSGLAVVAGAVKSSNDKKKAPPRAISEFFNHDTRESDLAEGVNDLQKLDEPKYGRVSYYFSKEELIGFECENADLLKTPSLMA